MSRVFTYLVFIALFSKSHDLYAIGGFLTVLRDDSSRACDTGFTDNTAFIELHKGEERHTSLVRAIAMNAARVVGAIDETHADVITGRWSDRYRYGDVFYHWEGQLYRSRERQYAVVPNSDVGFLLETLFKVDPVKFNRMELIHYFSLFDQVDRNVHLLEFLSQPDMRWLFYPEEHPHPRLGAVVLLGEKVFSHAGQNFRLSVTMASAPQSLELIVEGPSDFLDKLQASLLKKLSFVREYSEISRAELSLALNMRGLPSNYKIPLMEVMRFMLAERQK